jgi:AbrB family looped-hinge helix DNA binding protein
MSLIEANYISKNNFTNLTMIDTIKLSSKGQVVIPESFRTKFGIKEGSRFIIRDVGDKLILQKEDVFLKHFSDLEEFKEELGWKALAEKSFFKVWDNAEDEKEWKKYL